jgi:hypothetical protein
VTTYLSQATPYDEPTITWEDLKVDNFVIDEAHNFKGLFEPDSRGGKVEYLTSGGTSDRAWRMEYLTHTVKARGGQIMLLTATPAKQSPVDFYNIVQLLGSRGIGKDQNLYNLFSINTAEQFISRFVCIQERVIVDSSYQAKRGPAATMFGPYDNLLSEFTQIFKRYSDRKTVADAPYLRGKTAATTDRSAYSDKQLAKKATSPIWGKATWEEGKNVLTTYGPSLVKTFAAYGLDPAYDEALGVSGLKRARLRVLKGDDSGDYRVMNYHSEPTETKGRYRNTITVLPTFGGNAGGTMEAQGWSLFVQTKVPIPIMLKPVISMLPAQRELYEDFQRALGDMLAAGTNVRGIKAKIGDKEGVMVLRRDIFSTLSRLALHPALQSFTEAFVIEDEEDEEEEEEGEEETAEEVDPLLKQKKISEAAAQNFNDGVVMSYRPGIDPDVFDSAKNSLGSIIKCQQAFVGADEEKVTDPGKLGWRGTVRILNPEFVSLRNLYKKLSKESAEATKGIDVETMQKEDFSPEEIEEALAQAKADWNDAENNLGAVGAGKSAERTESTNKEILEDVQTALSPSLTKKERGSVLKYIWNEDANKPFSPRAITQVKKVAASKTFKGGSRMEGLWSLKATSSRTVAISDTIVAQALHDTVNPYMGDVTCGNLVFVNNLMYQAMQLITLCRVNALAKAAQVELETYKEFLDGATPRQNELEEILSWYGIGDQSWGLPFTARALLNITFPKADIANLGTGNTDPGDPNAQGLHETCKEVRRVLRAIHEQAFGDAGGTYAEGDPNTAPVEFTGDRYRDVGLTPQCWNWLQGKDTEPSRWGRYNVDADDIQRTYYKGWANQGSRVCVFNSASAPSGIREALAQLFNGEYEQQIDSDGNTINVAIRSPKYDVVLANKVAYEGIDLQTRTCRIIHADLPFTPSDIIQRNGRAVRQGNLYEETEIQAVLAMNSVDYYRIQAIERKRGWLDSALDEGKASYELTNNERELLELATKAVLPEQQEAVAERVRGRLEAIEAEEEQRAFSPVINQLTIAAEKQRTININSAADAEVYKNSIEANKRAKQVSVKMASRPTGGCG